MEMKTLPLLTLEKPTNEDGAICEVKHSTSTILSRINELPKDKVVCAIL